jgi:hypothetical protein
LSERRRRPAVEPRELSCQRSWVHTRSRFYVPMAVVGTCVHLTDSLVESSVRTELASQNGRLTQIGPASYDASSTHEVRRALKNHRRIEEPRLVGRHGTLFKNA